MPLHRAAWGRKHVIGTPAAGRLPVPDSPRAISTRWKPPVVDHPPEHCLALALILHPHIGLHPASAKAGAQPGGEAGITSTFAVFACRVRARPVLRIEAHPPRAVSVPARQVEELLEEVAPGAGEEVAEDEVARLHEEDLPPVGHAQVAIAAVGAIDEVESLR